MKSIAEEGQRRWTRSRTPQPCVKCEAQSSLAPASMCSTSCPNAPGSAIFLLKRPHPAKKKSEVPESAACRSKTHRLLVTYRCKPEFRPPYSSIHSTSPSPPLALRRLGPSPSSATTVAGHVFILFFAVSIRKQSQQHQPRPCFREPPASRGPRPSAPLPRPVSRPGGPSPPMPPRRRWPARSPRCVSLLSRCAGAGMAVMGSCGSTSMAEDGADRSGR